MKDPISKSMMHDEGGSLFQDLLDVDLDKGLCMVTREVTIAKLPSFQ